MRKLTAISPVLLLQRIGYPKRDTTSKLRFASSRIMPLRGSTTVSRWPDRAISEARFLTSEKSLRVPIQACVSGRCKCFSNWLANWDVRNHKDTETQGRRGKQVGPLP